MYVVDRGMIERGSKSTIQNIDQMAWKNGGTRVTKHAMGQNLEAERRTESSGKASSRGARGITLRHYGRWIYWIEGMDSVPQGMVIDSPKGPAISS